MSLVCIGIHFVRESYGSTNLGSVTRRPATCYCFLIRTARPIIPGGHRHELMLCFLAWAIATSRLPSPATCLQHLKMEIIRILPFLKTQQKTRRLFAYNMQFMVSPKQDN